MKKIFILLALVFGFMSIGHAADPQAFYMEVAANHVQEGEYTILFQYGEQKFVSLDVLKEIKGKGLLPHKDDFKKVTYLAGTPLQIMIIDHAKWQVIYSTVVSPGEIREAFFDERKRVQILTEKEDILGAVINFKK